MQSAQVKKDEENRARAVFPAALAPYLPVLTIAGFWLLALAFVGIAGEFPLNDDWIYSEALQHFLTTGQLRLIACAPACLFHVVCTAGVCKLFGFSYVLLRAAGFFWAVVATFALYGCCRQLQLRRPTALFFAFCLAANPLFMCVAFTFMSDTPAIALTLAFTFFLLAGLKEQKESRFLLAALCLIAATSIRQNLGCLAAANLAVLCLFWLRKKHSWTILLGLVLSPLATSFLADKWLLATSGYSPVYLWYKEMVSKQALLLLHTPGRNLPVYLQVAGELLTYLGLFLLPVLLCFLPVFGRFFRNKGNLNPAIPLASCFVVVFSLSRFILGENRWMPFSQNLLRLPELGAHTILGINYALLSSRWREYLTWLSGLAGFIMGALILDCLVRTGLSLRRFCRTATVQTAGETTVQTAGAAAQRQFGNKLCMLAVVTLFLIEFAFNNLQSTFADLDRYYLFPLSGALLLLALSWRRHRIKLACFVALPFLLAMAAYSLAATQDMMAWQRARWQAIGKLEASGVTYKQIDGGAEYNFARDPKLGTNLILSGTCYEYTHRGEPPRNLWRWWSVAGEEYIISFSPVPGYDISAKEKYWSALGGHREILVLHRVP